MTIPVINKRVNSDSFIWGIGTAVALMILPKVSDYVIPYINKARTAVNDAIGGGAK